MNATSSSSMWKGDCNMLGMSNMHKLFLSKESRVFLSGSQNKDKKRFVQNCC